MSTKHNRWWQSSKVQKAANVAGKVAEFAVHLTASTTTIGKIGAALGVTQAFLGDPPPFAEDYADCRTLPLPSAVNRFVVKTLRESGAIIQGRSTDQESELLLRHGEASLAWVTSGDQDPAGPWLTDIGHEEAKGVIGRALWEHLGPSLRLRIVDCGRDIELLPDMLAGHAASELAERIGTDATLFNKSGHKRSVLLFGPSGTGKSWIMREVSRIRGDFSIRHAAHWNTDDVLPGVCDLLRPKTVLLDDIDRSMSASSRTRSGVAGASSVNRSFSLGACFGRDGTG